MDTKYTTIKDKLIEHAALDLRAMSSGPTLGTEISSGKFFKNVEYKSIKDVVETDYKT